MKTKKFLIQICLMLACILLQAHIILPHFHHDGVICIVNESHSVNDQSHTKDHSAENEDSCDIKQIVVRQNDLDDHLDHSHAVKLLSQYCMMHPLSNLLLELPDSETERVQIPYTDTYTSPYTGSITSLRAPPVSSFLG